MVGTATPQRHEAPAGAVPRQWGILRTVLLAVLGVLIVGTALTGTRPASLEDLHDALRSGEVSEVHLVGFLPPGEVTPPGEDVLVQEILWQDGWLDRHTTLTAESGQSPLRNGQEVSAELAASSVGELRITSQDVITDTQWSLFDWRVATWVGFTALMWMLVTLVTLFTSPTPRRATRWAWFWLTCGTGGLALAVYPLLGLPRAGEPFRPTGRRLTGGWAFLIAVFVLSPMVG